MSLVSFLVRLIVPLAHADVSDIGAGSPGVSAMWAVIKSTFPHSDLGATAPLFFMARVAQFVLALIGGTAICAIVYAGIIVTTAGGDSGKISEAKTIIIYALSGVVLATLADSIVFYICNYIIPLIAGGGAGQCPLW